MGKAMLHAVNYPRHHCNGYVSRETGISHSHNHFSSQPANLPRCRCNTSTVQLSLSPLSPFVLSRTQSRTCPYMLARQLVRLLDDEELTRSFARMRQNGFRSNPQASDFHTPNACIALELSLPDIKRKNEFTTETLIIWKRRQLYFI